MNQQDIEQKNLINWYPGHMAKGMREIKENSHLVDLIIVILDARCPISSYNKDFDQIAPTKPRLFIITKSDLMDPSKKTMINEKFKDKHLLWLDLRKPNSKKIIEDKINQITFEKQQRDLKKGLLKPRIKVFVVGIPNVGKSSLINLLTQKKSLKVANFPGVTRIKNWVSIGNLFLMDTPGILLPKIDDLETGIKLVAINSINSNIFPKHFLVVNFLKLIYKYYPKLLEKEFNFSNQITNDDEAKVLIDKIATDRKFINQKSQIDYNRTYSYVENWIKDLKKITYE